MKTIINYCRISFACVVCLFLLQACTGVTNKGVTIVVPDNPSVDTDGESDSGLKYAFSDGKKFLISEDARATYNELIEAYGDEVLTKNVNKKDHGITGPYYIMSKQALENWGRLSIRKHNQGVLTNDKKK